MTRTTIALLTSIAMVLGSAVTVTAQGKGSGKTHVTSTKTTKVSAPKTTSSPKMQTSGPKKTTGSTTSKGPKTTTVKATKPAKTTTSTTSAKANTKTATKLAKADAKSTKGDAKAAKVETKKTAKADARTAKAEGTTTTSGDGDETPVTLTKVQEKLQKNTKLAEKLEGRLPAGTDLMEAAEGFRNLGQFVAAVNVSNNLGLDFEKLKTAMVDDGRSLGQAIQYVKNDVESPTTVAQRAETDAQRLITETETQTTTTTTSNTTTKAKSKDKPKRTLRTQGAS